MSNLETSPEERGCGGAAPAGPRSTVAPREVPLGGTRAITVRRTLPHRDRSTVGAWCFLDEYGPTAVPPGSDGGVHVPPHPHTGLQTVTWLVTGEVRHRDSLGSDVVVRPGELNLMTSGRGISHSEHTPDEHGPVLRGVQLWVALPSAVLDREPDFAQHRDLPVVTVDDAQVQVFVGELAGARSPAVVHTPLLGAQVVLPAGGRAGLDLRTDREHGVLVLDGSVVVDGEVLPAGPLLHVPPGATRLEVVSAGGAVLLLLGGVPFTEELVMWWNFVGRSHEDVAAARADWADGTRFGVVPGGEPVLAAPPLPGVRLRPRRR